MRVLVAIDGSAQSRAAVDLVSSLAWPDGTCIRVVAVVERTSALVTGLSQFSEAESDYEALAASLDADLQDARVQLESVGRVVDTRRFEGRPGSVIVRQGSEFHADLVVVGSRGLGPLRSMLLGSVSAEVVDHAPCPVLVAREPSVGSILVAVDGSPSAQRALEHLGGSGYLAGHAAEVMTVGALARQDTLEAQAAAAAQQLGTDGVAVRWSIAVGDPAHEIIRSANDFGCNLIVMGSRGLTGLDRLRLGSVARNVLLHTQASVLVVRERIHERHSEPRDDAGRAVALAG